MKPKILIVEDEPAIADNIKFALEKEGFVIDWHSCGGGVLDCLAQTAVHLVILDIGLPDVNGLELCKEIRKNHAVPIIFLTARADEIDRIVGLEIGADDYMVKPFSPRELAARVKAVLRRTHQKEAPEKGGGPAKAFQIDEARHRISYFSTPLDLSRYEFKLLCVLIKRPGQVFSRDSLMAHVWDEPEMSLDRSVDAHIKNIRKKLKALDPDLDPIVTNRNLGYAFKEDL